MKRPLTKWKDAGFDITLGPQDLTPEGKRRLWLEYFQNKRKRLRELRARGKRVILPKGYERET